MTVIEQQILDTITAEFLNNKANWDKATENDQINTHWVKWVSLHIIAARIGTTIKETMAILANMKSNGLVDSKLQINQQFFACPIPGYKQHREKDYYFKPIKTQLWPDLT